MTIKDMFIVNVFFLFLAFISGVLINSKDIGYVLVVLLAPQIILSVPFFFYSRLALLMEVCGGRKVTNVKVRPSAVILIMIVSVMILSAIYNAYFKFNTDDFFEISMLISILISNALGLSLVVLFVVIVCYML